MTTTTTRRFSFGELVTLTGAPAHRVRYMLTSRRIAPVEVISGMNLFDQTALATLKAALVTPRTPRVLTHEAMA